MTELSVGPALIYVIYKKLVRISFNNSRTSNNLLYSPCLKCMKWSSPSNNYYQSVILSQLLFQLFIWSSIQRDLLITWALWKLEHLKKPVFRLFAENGIIDLKSSPCSINCFRRITAHDLRENGIVDLILTCMSSWPRIVEITTNSPQGFIKTPVVLYAPQEYYVNVTWTPTSSKIETKIFCFTGLEDTGWDIHWNHIRYGFYKT